MKNKNICLKYLLMELALFFIINLKLVFIIVTLCFNFCELLPSIIKPINYVI